MRTENTFDLGLFSATLLTLLLLAVAASAGPDSTNDDDDDDDDGAVFRAWPGLGMGHKMGSGVLAVPQIGFSLPLFPVLEPEVVAGLGVNVSGRTFEMINRFSFGLRWFLPPALSEGRGGAFDVDEVVRPFLWTALHHGHGDDVLLLLDLAVGLPLTLER